MTNVYVMKNRLINLVIMFNRGGNIASHVNNRLTKCRQSFYVYLVPVCYIQEPLLMFKRICINVYVNQR